MRAFVPSSGDLTPGTLGNLRGIGPMTVGGSVATLLGSALGGALIGYVAATSKNGALKGAAFAVGLAGVSDGVHGFDDNPLLSAALVGVGLGGLYWSLIAAQGGVFRR